jgi:hypothetical protein
MLDFLIGFVIGGVMFGCAVKMDSHSANIKRIAAQEVEYLNLQRHVNNAVNSIDDIVHGKPAVGSQRAAERINL